jgi:hypothetical protein
MAKKKPVIFLPRTYQLEHVGTVLVTCRQALEVAQRAITQGDKDRKAAETASPELRDLLHSCVRDAEAVALERITEALALFEYAPEPDDE